MKYESKYNTKEKALVFALAIGIGTFLSMLSVLVLAFLSLILDLGEASASLFAALSLAIGGFSSAFLSSKKFKKNGLLNGVICAAATFLLVFFISLVVDKDGITLNTLFNLLAALLSGLIGGIFGTGDKKYDRI